jgi:hypothetical protein
MTSESQTAPNTTLLSLRRFASHPAAGWAIVGLGIVLRLRRYLRDRGLLHDETQLATNVLSKSFGHLFRPLDLGDQAAPVGFLILQKCSILCFGGGEWAIRLVPLLAGVIALPLFFRTIRKIAGVSIALLATAWLALAEPLIRYAAEGKQYSTDVLWTTVLLALALGAATELELALLTVVGAVLLWFSHPLLFVAGGIGLSLLIEHLRLRKLRLASIDIGMGIFWLASFTLNYLAISRHYVANGYLTAYWADAFAPLPSTWANIAWYPRTLLRLFDYPLGIAPPKFIAISALAAAVLVIGFFLLASRRRMFWILVLTIVLAMVASGLHRYPFAERLTLFLAPFLVLPLAFCLGANWRVGAGPAVVVLGAALFAYPVYLQAKYFIHPPVLYDVKPAIRFIRAHWQRGDVIYLHFGSDVVGRYYLRQPEFSLPDLVVVRGVYEPDVAARPQRYESDLQSVRGRPHVWIVFSMASQPDRQIYERILDQHGRLLDRHIYNGGAVELYDLR